MGQQRIRQAQDHPFGQAFHGFGTCGKRRNRGVILQKFDLDG
jgi:hypothetical protein